MGRPHLLLPVLLAILMAGCAQGEAPSEVETRVEEGLGPNISPLKAEIRNTRATDKKKISKNSVKKGKPKKPKKGKPKTQKKNHRTRQAKSKGKGKGKNRKRKGKKGKKSKKKKKKPKKTKRKNRKNKQPRQCTNDVDDDCLTNAKDALDFEKGQIQNFFKTEARMKGHKRVSGNKYNKNDKFNESAYYMLKALGGDLSKPTCGDGDSKTSTRAAVEAMANYKTLSNCSATIMEACEMPSGTHTMNETFYTGCGEMYNKTKNVSEECRTNDAYKDNGPAACACWKETMKYIEEIKANKCTTLGRAQSKKMLQQRRKCISAFQVCKKAEDAAISLIHTCMSGDVDTNTGANEASLARAKGM